MRICIHISFTCTINTSTHVVLAAYLGTYIHSPHANDSWPHACIISYVHGRRNHQMSSLKAGISYVRPPKKKWQFCPCLWGWQGRAKDREIGAPGKSQTPIHDPCVCVCACACDCESAFACLTVCVWLCDCVCVHKCVCVSMCGTIRVWLCTCQCLTACVRVIQFHDLRT